MKRTKALLTALMLVAITVLIMGCPNESTSAPTPPQTLEQPVISPDRESFEISQEITITSDDAEASIHYTTDGSAPEVDGKNTTKYIAPFSIGGTNKVGEKIVVRAIAVKDRHANSAEATKRLTKKQLLEMVQVDGGTFLMGTPYSNGNGSDDDERPQRNVTVKSFYMGETEVTVKQYKDVMNKNTSDENTVDSKPLANVTWLAAVTFCNTLSNAEGLTAYYTISGNSVTIADASEFGYRLPTEAEWEYAAGGGNGTRTIYAGTNNQNSLKDYAVHNATSTATVKSKEPNTLGLYDMSGNVWEWCWDWYGSYNTTPNSSGTERVYRGGAFQLNWRFVRVAYRQKLDPGKYSNNIGFRVVRSAEK